MLHRFFILLGTLVAAAWFGAHWSTTAGIASGALGLVLGLAFASGIDEPVSFVTAVPRWLSLLTGVACTGGALGWVVDQLGNGHGAVVPSSIVAGLIGLWLCSGIRVG